MNFTRKSLIMIITLMIGLSLLAGCSGMDSSRAPDSGEPDVNDEGSNIPGEKPGDDEVPQPIEETPKKSDPELRAEEILKNMSLEQKVGQMIIVGFDGFQPSDAAREMIQRYNVGSVILFPRNIKDSRQLLELNNQLKVLNSDNVLPLIISADQEGGRVVRLPSDATLFPSSLTIGSHGSPQLAYDVGLITGREMKAYGFNLDFAPVLDIFSNPQNTVIGDRAFGKTPETVSEMAIGAMKGLRDGGVIPVAKHFPGHGDTVMDSHIDLPSLAHDLKRLEEFELIPFKKAVEEGVDMIMVAHIELPMISGAGLPSSLSHEVITGILREKMGFNGVVITDDMEMGAIDRHFGIKEATVKAVLAGNDIVSICHSYEKQVGAIEALIQGVESGEISEERINESVKRIIILKLKYGLSDRPVDPALLQERVGTKDHKAVAEEARKTP